ncbi:PAS domain-containing sensor histidine kinase [uncultured Pontibacter sp.]|uniref:PAS domain-containing sensor histidine kinase n=1 Tax=uncultured Pontibacter sp. TaxID=453356 RepID=UPI002618D17B|nr:PAS domain-containing sensor histidine kinase [uncultured Pontibacter sp.]
MKHSDKHLGYERIIRYIGISFYSMLAALLMVGMFFYVQTKGVQEEHNTNIQHIYKRLELVNKLFENKETTQTLLRAHLNTQDVSKKDSLKQQLVQAYIANQATIQELHYVLEQPGQLQKLHNLSEDLDTYHFHVDSLLELSGKQQQKEAIAYSSAHMGAFYMRNQANLISLNKELTVSAHEYTNSFVPAFSQLVDEHILLILLVVFLIVWAAFAFNKVTKRLQHENEKLNKEIREREMLQQTLNETRLHFQRLFKKNPIPMWVYDQDTFKFLEVNEAAMQEYGYTREEFLQMDVFSLRPTKDIESTKSILDQLDKRSDAVVEGALHQRKDGSLFKVNLKSHPIKEQENISPRLVTCENVQDREEFIAELARNEKQLREVSSSIPGAVYQYKRDENGNISLPFVSDGIANLFDVTPEEVYIDPYIIFEAVHPQDLDGVNRSIDASTCEFKPWIHDLRIWNKAQEKWTWIRGHCLPSSKNDGTVLYNGTFIDITDQKEAQAKLITSEANLRALLDSSPQAIYLLDKELNIILFNAVAAAEVKQITLNELKAGQSILAYTSEELKETLVASHAQALEGKTVQYETGSGELWFEVAYRPILTEDQEVIAVALSIHDNSEQHKTIATIKDSEAKLARAQNLAKIGNWEFDTLKETLTLSEYIYTIYGISPLTFIPSINSVTGFFHPEDKERVMQDFCRVSEEGTQVVTEHRIILEDGTQKYLHQTMEPYFNSNHQVIRITGTTQDITEQKQKEQEIREARNRFQSTIENIPEIILSTDAQLKIIYISPQCREVTGYSEEEFKQEHLWPKVIYKQDLPQLQTILDTQILAGEKIQHEMRIITRDNKTKWILLRMSPMLGKNGEIIRIDGSVADINERKLIEAKRIVLTEQLQVQNQNLKQFAYIVSHNLRAPIANILGLTSIYNKIEPQAESNKKVVENLAKSAQHLDHTIRDLNDILTIRGQILDVSEQVYFEDILKDILKSLTLEIEKTGAQIAYNFCEACSVVSLRSYVHSILLNLLTNALKYRDPNRVPKICLRSSRQKDYICIEISDNGLGIDLAKEKGKLFGLYKRFHHHIEGRGLGLHLVKTQVDLLDGKIEVDSRVGEGTMFKIYL